jgi:hypothetical protein
MHPSDPAVTPTGQPSPSTGRRRHKLLRSSSFSSEAAGSPESASSDPEGSVAADQSTAARGETSSAAANPAKDHPSESAPAGGLESGDDPDQLMRQEQAALFLGVTPRCLENWRYRGGGPQWIEISTRCIRYRRSDLIQFVKERMRTNTTNCGTDAA